MAREIWKFNRFEGGINTGTDAKDIKNNEFVELVDCDISKVGIIKSLGHALKDSTIPSTTIQNEIIPGQGLFHYFSDYSYAPTNENHNDFQLISDGQIEEYGFNAKAAQIEISTEGYMLWAFRGKPTGGELRLSVQVYNDTTGDWNPIHGELNGSGSYLTVLKGTDWSVLGQASLSAGDVNLFNNHTYYHYPENDGTLQSSASSGELYPAEIWTSMLDIGASPNYFGVYSGLSTVTPGQINTAVDGATQAGDDYSILHNNSPNWWGGIALNGADSSPSYYWSSVNRPGINNTSSDYVHLNDTRFALNPSF